MFSHSDVIECYSIASFTNKSVYISDQKVLARRPPGVHKVLGDGSGDVPVCWVFVLRRDGCPPGEAVGIDEEVVSNMAEQIGFILNYSWWRV